MKGTKYVLDSMTVRWAAGGILAFLAFAFGVGQELLPSVDDLMNAILAMATVVSFIMTIIGRIRAEKKVTFTQ